jgi:hypothetical protein
VLVRTGKVRPEARQEGSILEPRSATSEGPGEQQEHKQKQQEHQRADENAARQADNNEHDDQQHK